MQQPTYDYGMIGLGTMGSNLVYNMCDHGYSVAGYDKNAAQVATFVNGAGDKKVFGTLELPDFIDSLKQPRVIMMLIPAGAVVDAVIQELKPYLSKNDLLIDCGNSYFMDTDRRLAELAKDHIHFMGVGVSGGESGARFGPSIMPGGPQEVYERVEGMLKAVSAKVNDEPCVTYLGTSSAGHYVKMVHNGIEYGIMQLISEAYHLLKQMGGLNNDELHEVFLQWNKGMLQSFLIEITAEVFAKQDEQSGNRLVDMILDTAHQKGTGQWTSQNAMDLHVPIPSIDIAVSARDISSLKTERVAAGEILKGPGKPPADRQELIQNLEQSLYFAMITTYAQGMSLLQQASVKYKYGLKLKDVAGIWRGGCIIRASLLEDIRQAFEENASLVNIMISGGIAKKLMESQQAARKTIQLGVAAGIPLPCTMACLSYFDGYRSGWLPANLLQAQRDFFGAHTYERNDKAGIFHTEWI